MPAGLLLELRAVLAQQVMEFGGAHLVLEFGLHQDLPQHVVRGHQDVVVVQQDVVDADDADLPELRVRRERRAAVERHVHRVVHVVVEIGAGRDDPVDETGLDERNDHRGAQSRRSQGARRGSCRR